MSQAEPAPAHVLESLKRQDMPARTVELRLNMDAWPEGVDPKAYYVTDLHKAALDAGAAYVGFAATQRRNRANPNLTPTGAFAGDVEWADKFLGPVRERRDALRVERDEKRQQVLKNLTVEQSAAPDDPHTIAMHREIRDALGKLPQEARKLKVIEWTMGGDDEALRAVLTVPAYLTGLKPDDLTEIRELVARRRDPERFARYEAYLKAAEFAERALDGVVRFVEQETRADARQLHEQNLERERRRRAFAEAQLAAGITNHTPSQVE